MKRLCILLLAFVLGHLNASAFCGFFVAKAGAKLFNSTSQVIIVRDQDRSVVTMSNDFQGNAKDFAMVIPVPVLLEEKQIRVVKRKLFTQADEYSAPRVAAYYDKDPCYVPSRHRYDLLASESAMMMKLSDENEGYYKVTILAKYEVGEYDIMILSAEESQGLKRWLIDNGYSIPDKAEEVLAPYIKNDMKFFVAKVDVSRMKEKELSPLQIEYNTDRFMLPIRLGMANANGDQDMIVHAYTSNGRIECTNYRTVEMPHDIHVPLFIQEDFGSFYKTIFNRKYDKEGGRAVFLEYAWDVSPRRSVKCDPCVGPPPVDQDLVTIGVNWAENPLGTIFYTRLHVRYNRQNFPQDLQFQVTPNRDRFQCRYVVTHPAKSQFNCAKGQTYLEELIKKRKDELYNYAMLTGEPISNHSNYVEIYEQMLDDEGGYLPEDLSPGDEHTGSVGNAWAIWLIAFFSLIIVLIGDKLKRKLNELHQKS